MPLSSPRPDVVFADLVSTFGIEVLRKLHAQSGQPEAQLRDPFARLLRDAGRVMGLDVLTVDETPLDALGVRPDFMVNVAGAQVGYAELKAAGRRVPTTWSPDARERRQWERLSQLPNVLYTDGQEWAVYHYGVLQGSVARLSGDLRSAGSRLSPVDSAFEQVLRDFLLWKPSSPRNIRELVRAVARLCSLLRDEVQSTLARERSGEETEAIFTALAGDWREYLFPGLPDADFADAYAQTVTFALLLARADGISFDELHLAEIARRLGMHHPLMGKALGVLTENTAEHRSLVAGTLLRVVGAVDWDILNEGNADAYLHLYEHFLEEYDPALRRRSGSYYTPNEVAAFMVRFTDDILRKRMRIARGLASGDVTIIDPGMGSGTYLLNVIDSVARTIEQEEGNKAVPPQLRHLLGRLIGFDRQTGPYAVTELRMRQALRRYQTEVPAREVMCFVADTLADPYAPQGYIPAILEPIARSRREANRIKRELPIQVVVGNPPYGQRARNLGGWILHGKSGAGDESPLKAFVALGQGKYEHVLYNQYVFFWRWATWKAFDAHPDSPSGIVAFITPSSFTKSKGHAGMREYLRRTADEGWVIDMSDGFRADVNTRVFPGVQHKVCIAVFARYRESDRDTPARIHHMSLAGTRNDKFDQLASLTSEDPRWIECPSGWQDLFQPPSGQDWEQFPSLDDLMPWSLPGVKPNRKWVISPDGATLQSRWDRIVHAASQEKAQLLKETRDRAIDSTPPPLPGTTEPALPIDRETSTAVRIEPFAMRSFDRQFIIYDPRVIDYPRPGLWQVRGSRQVYATEQHVHPIDSGPGLTFTALVPGMDHFNGRGGKVRPLYRDADGFVPNLAPGITHAIAHRLAVSVLPEDVLAYIAGVVAHPAYTARFRNDLKVPGIRVPLTADPALWAEAVATGRRILWLHSFGERYTDPEDNRPEGPPRLPVGSRPRVVETIPDTPERMPRQVSYDVATRTLHVGEGRIYPVIPEAWKYEVSGMVVLRKWFDYRKRKPRVRRSSPLDDVNPPAWTPGFTTELLDMINVLSLCVALEPIQSALLERVCSSPMITNADL